MKKTGIAVLALLMAATFAAADNHPDGPGPGAPAAYDGGGGYLDVASDGTVIIRRAAASSTRGNPVAELVAIRNGAIAWTATLPSPRTETEISGAQVIEVGEATPSGATPMTTLTALSIANGTQAWTLTITGRVNNLTPFSGGTYAVVLIPAATSGGTPTRNLVAISSNGVVLSTVAF